MCIEKERDPRNKLVHIHASIDAVFHILNSVAQGKGQFLQRRRSCLAYVVAANRYRVVFWYVFRRVFKGVDDQLHRRFDRVYPFFLRDVFLQDIVLQSARDLFEIGFLFLGDDQIHRQKDRGGRIYRLRDRHLIERNAVE